MPSSLVLAASLLLVAYLYNQLRYKRFRQYAGIPQLPPSLLLGYLAQGRADRHPDSVFIQMNNDLGRPPLVFVDLRPVNRPVVLIRSHEIVEQISKASKLYPTSTPKSDLGYLEPVIGPTSILTLHGERWKSLRKRYNPGFAPQYLMTLLPCILDKTMSFIKHLNTFAKTSSDFQLYISAVIRETLRLHPPAATARMSAPGSGFAVRAPDGREHRLDGMIIYNCETLILRDPEVYGESGDVFAPERWLSQDDESSEKGSDPPSHQVPTSAWRPFERGPRSCIGQEVANIDLCVIVAAIARRYDFTKVGLGERKMDGSGLPAMA
ncbi:hypothetical protein M426DRAFT_258748 [Hypoxylon sp. CI-4A]|nr:hypothetical protein M426DRAFT_258748 [Hypoxylon sp. CI-4A]